MYTEVEDKVLYDGNNRFRLRGVLGVVKAIKRDAYQLPQSALVDFDGEEEWVGCGSLRQHPDYCINCKQPLAVKGVTGLCAMDHTYQEPIGNLVESVEVLVQQTRTLVAAAQAVVTIKRTGSGDLFAAIDNLASALGS